MVSAGGDENGRTARLGALIAGLRATGLDCDARELADALWLAARTGRPAPVEQPRPPEPARKTPVRGPDPVVPGPLEARYADAPPPTLLTMPDPEGAPATLETTPVLAPAAPALPDPQSLQRALRPLRRYRSPGRPPRRQLDEEATAGRAADTGLIIPVLRAARRQKARLLLLMDVSTSTVAWQTALEELNVTCAGAGVFQDVQVRYLHQGPDGSTGYAAGPDPGGPLRAAAQLGDPTGRRIILLLSDCAGPMWRSGAIQRLLYRWSASTPVAVVQPLPQRLWRRTHLPAYGGVLKRHEGPLGRLEFSSGPAAATARAGRPVPVLALRRNSVEGWARLASGATGHSLLTAAGWVRRDHSPSAAPVRAAARLSGEERVRAFRRTASPHAQRLAEYLTAVPLVLPVMRLVQHTMLAGTGPEALAEVLLGGIVRRAERADIELSDEPYYEFFDGVRVELAARLDRGEERLVLRHSSRYVERRFGRSARNFPAVAAAALGEGAALPVGGGQIPVGLRVFAEVAADTVRRRSAGIRSPLLDAHAGVDQLAGQATELLSQYTSGGDGRKLDAAIELLAEAVHGEGRPDRLRGLREEQATAYLARWQLRRMDEDLSSAWQAVEFSDALALPTVLYAMALAAAEGTLDPALAREVLGEDPERVPEQGPRDFDARTAERALLSLAGRHLQRLTEQGPQRDRSSVARLYIEVLRRLSRTPTAVETGLLREAAVVAERLAAAEPGVETWLLHGTLELDLARHVEGDDAVRDHAERARQVLQRAELAAHDRAQLVDILLKTAGALELAELTAGTGPQAQREGDGVPRRTVLDALTAALWAADDDATRYDCHRRLGDRYWRSFTDTGQPGHLDGAIENWRDALTVGRPAEPATLLTRLGRALLQRAERDGAAADFDDAVRRLREAADETPDGDAELPARRMLLGSAYGARYARSGRLADLYEAEWAYGAAARGATDPLVASRAWRHRGDIAAELARHTGTADHLQQAANHYAHAAEVDDVPLAGAARLARASVLEELAGPVEALREYETALHVMDAAEPSEIAGDTAARELWVRARDAVDRLWAEVGDQ